MKKLLFPYYVKAREAQKRATLSLTVDILSMPLRAYLWLILAGFVRALVS